MLCYMKGSVLSSMSLDGKQAHVQGFTTAWIDAASFEEIRMRTHIHSSGQKHCTMSLSYMF
jgi:hypothetical protein